MLFQKHKSNDDSIAKNDQGIFYNRSTLITIPQLSSVIGINKYSAAKKHFDANHLNQIVI